MTAQAAESRAKSAIFGREIEGAARESAQIAWDWPTPTIPPNTRLARTAQKLRTASPPPADFVVNVRL